MAMQDLKKDIEQRLLAFDRGDLTACGLALFQQLGYETDKRMGWSADGADDFLLETNGEGLLNLEKAKTGEWREFSLLFQLTRDEIAGGRQTRLDFGTNNQVDHNNYESYLFLGLRLGEETYSRKELAEITRQINKLFAMPVMVVFRYGALLTLAMIDRRPSKADALRDVLEKVTLIKDVMVRSPNRAHIEILYDLSLEALHKAHKFTDFLGLHRAWQKTLDISELNKQFFKELANWYFWTIAQVKFPDGAPKDSEGTDSPSVIRMITRLVFVWFLKEKGLVPDELFNQSDVKRLIHFETGDASSYYKAILQNLFFATLNQEMNTAKKSDNRKFRGKSKSGGRDQHYGVANTYRYEDLMRLPAEMLALFETVPFLNGGLFECLDDTEVTPAIRVDGFSDRADNQLLVPNQVFFSEEQDVDLNGTYGTKNKKYKVRGLIDILNRYKFTIAENTPLEQEIALDPELLGKVFENLLASYNEETKATARKQTGSFYTPREVVDYMVDESLKVYFGNALEASEDLELRLSRLLDYNSEGHDFGSAEVDRLIGAIDRLKMLDPAVGSGAFPMGILQKLVFVLSKLDPQNKRWRDAQIATAEGIEDIEARENAIVGIDEAFGRNELDYGRKLFLIQNCVYGVDIQPIAVQIAKLRFFISLIVEQKISEDITNRGIRPLPNLETKFVAANTLMGLGGQPVLKTEEILQKERELAKARKDHFGERNRQRKERCRERDRTLRGEIGELLKGLGFPGEIATKMSSWNPYDQNITSSFFDPSWMFGVQDGFDVVIGNPPYGAKVEKPDQVLYKTTYLHQNSYTETYLLFMEKAGSLIKQSGTISFIVPNTWLSSTTYKKIRKYLVRNYEWIRFLDIKDDVFKAVVDTHVFIFKKLSSPSKTSEDKFIKIEFYKEKKITLLQRLKVGTIPSDGSPVNLLADEESQELYRKIVRQNSLLKDMFHVFNGVKPFEKGKGTPPQTEEIMRTKPYVIKGEKPDKEWVPLLRGSLIQKYNVLWDNNYWILYGKWLAAPRNPEIFKSRKICIRQTGDSIIAALVGSNFVAMNNLHLIVPNANSYDLRVLLAILNSKIIEFIYFNINPEKGEVLAEVKKRPIHKFTSVTVTGFQKI